MQLVEVRKGRCSETPVRPSRVASCILVDKVKAQPIEIISVRPESARGTHSVRTAYLELPPAFDAAA